jgi:predicted ATPase/DNA-binding SARP family transcriptional activator
VLLISVLGPIEVQRDGEPVAVPGGKTSELLLRLALEAGVVVRTDRLIDDLWGDATSRNTLQSKVAKLRRALGDPDALVSGSDGYRLDVRPQDVDALAVVDRGAAAVRLLEAGDFTAATSAAGAALVAYRGEVLPAAGDAEWVGPHRARLEEVRATLVETELAARLELGGPGEVIGDLEAVVRELPFQEGLWALLITALYRAGRQADALATYQRVRAQLADELGLEPGPALRGLEQQVLSHDVALAPAPAEPVLVGNLPSLGTELIGRAAEVDDLVDRLGRERLVELVGPGGIGKTAVALAAGRVLAATGTPVWLARLETAVTADDVVDTLVAAVGVPGESALLERLRTVDGVVILDNGEHVVDAAAALATKLVDAAPGLRVLCTSQVPLDVDGEVVVELAPLRLDDAVDLFSRRAVAQRANRAVDPEDDAVQTLCRSLDGLPLAIELAAARTKTLSIEEITRRLDDRFDVLSDPASRRPERRRALRATIRWSYDLLFPDDQRGLWALAVFAGGAPLAAVESVLGALDVPPGAAIDVVGRLASRSLVIVDGQAGGDRYRLLDSIRAFAVEAMTEAGMADRAGAAHAAWFSAVAATSTAGVRSADQAAHLALARSERANIDAALAWSARHDPQRALDLVNGFGWAWIVLGDSRAAQRALSALAAAGDRASAEDRAVALLVAGWVEASTGRIELAHGHIDEASALASEIGDADLRARAAYHLAYVVSHDGDWAEALALTDRARALYDDLDRPWDQVANGLFAARAAISAGDESRSTALRDDLERWLAVVEDPWMHVRYEAVLGELARVQRRFDDAVVHLGRAAETSRRLGFQQTEAYQVSSLGRAQWQAGDREGGAATLALAVEKAEATGDVRMAALARVHLGRVLRALGREAEARAALEAAAVWHAAEGGGEQAALGDCLLAAMDGDEARLTALLDDARRREDAPVEVFTLDALARLARERGDGPLGQALAEEADDRMAVASHFITEADRVDA